MGRSLRRALAVTATVLAIVLGAAGPAAADPPGPTDYRSEITAIEPPTDGVEVEVVGGDSFIRLRRTGDERVDVMGYGGEPYLRFEPDGRVLENQRSPATFLNRDRTGEVDLPTEADADAEPEWEEVAADGTFSWHDHRTHWMSSARPPGRSPGDRVLEGVVPAAGRRPGRRRGRGLVLGGGALAGARRPGRAGRPGRGRPPRGAEVAHHRPRPRRRSHLGRGPGPRAGVVPLGAGRHRPAADPVGPAPGRRGRRRGRGLLRRLQPPVRAGLVAVAGIELLWWAWTRQAALTRALIPTDAPPALDRAVVAAVAVLAVGILVAAGPRRAGDLAGTGPGGPPEA